MIQTKNFYVNGELYYTTYKITILDVLTYLNYDNSLFVLEYNNCISYQKMWSQIFINSKDRIEIVTIVGGG